MGRCGHLLALLWTWVAVAEPSAASDARVLAVDASDGAGGDGCRLPFTPRDYTAYRLEAGSAIELDGQLDEPAWQQVAWTEDFVDISTSVTPRFRTRAKMRWDDEWLYVGAHLQEPDVWANISKHNEVIFHDNDFEIFVDADGTTHNYKEFEVNAANATWDLLINRPYADGGGENSKRVNPETGWDMVPPLQSAVHVDGRINDPADARDDKWWGVEVKLPLARLADGKEGVRVPPADGDIWRINFSRVEWHVKAVDGMYRKDDSYPHEDNWSWSPQGQIQMHLPERWGFLQLSAQPVNTTTFQVPRDWAVRSVAMDLYYAQHSHKEATGNFTDQLDALKPLAPNGLLDGSCALPPTIVAADGGFEAIVPDLQRRVSAMIRDDRFLTVA